MSNFLSSGAAIQNLLGIMNYKQRQEELDRVHRKDQVQEAAANSFINNGGLSGGAVGSPAITQRTFTPNPEDSISDQVFGGEPTAADSGPMTIGQNAPAQNLLGVDALKRNLATAMGPREFVASQQALAKPQYEKMENGDIVQMNGPNGPKLAYRGGGKLPEGLGPDGTPIPGYVALQGALAAAKQTPEELLLKKAQTGSAAARAAHDDAQTKLLSDSGMSEDTLDRLSDAMVIAGQPLSQVAPNLGRGAAGQANLNRLQDAVTAKARARNLGGADMAALNNQFKAVGSAMVANEKSAAGVSAAANELDDMIPLVRDASAGVSRMKWVPVNQLTNFALQQGSDPAYGRLSVAIQGAKTAYAQAMARNGQTTDMSRAKADKLIDGAQGADDLMARLDMLQKEAVVSKDARVRVGQDLSARSRGAAAPLPGAVAPQASAAPGAMPPGMVRQVGTYQGMPVYIDAQGQRHVVQN